MTVVKERAKRVKMLILDIDGVMTDGRIIYDDKGNELKCFNVLDGMGFVLLGATQIKVALITAKGSKAVLRRARDIGAVEVKLNALDKLSAFRQILKKYNLSSKDICFIGDDLVDFPVMKRAGLAVAVANACSEAKKVAHYVTKKEGGKGAVREVIEIILRAQNKWSKLVSRYLACLICIVGLLAAGCAQKSELVQSEQVSTSQKELEEAPDEMLSSFSVTGYTTGGKRQWDLEGKSADIMTEEIKLIDVLGRVYGKEMNMTIVADEGSLNRINNSVHLERNVQTTTDDGATLTTDSLDWDAQNEKLSNDVPTWIRRKMMEAYGVGIVGEPSLNLVQLKKDVIVKISLPEAGKEASLPPTVITCDGSLEVDYENNLATFQDKVKVKDNRGEIFADRIDVYFSTEAEETKQIEGMEGVGIEKVVATGNTEIHHGGNITYSQKAVYDTATGKLTLTGEPKLVIYSTDTFSQLMESE